MSVLSLTVVKKCGNKFTCTRYVGTIYVHASKIFCRYVLMKIKSSRKVLLRDLVYTLPIFSSVSRSLWSRDQKGKKKNLKWLAPKLGIFTHHRSWMMHAGIKKKGLFFNSRLQNIARFKRRHSLISVAHIEAEMLQLNVILRKCFQLSTTSDGVYNPFSVIGNETHSEQYTFFPWMSTYISSYLFGA